MTGADSADVVVVGAGAVGASVAYELASRGVSVTVLDQGRGVGHGCSYANAGLLAPSHVEPLATPANVAAGLRYMWRPDGPFYIRPTPRLAPWLTRFVASSGPRRARLLTERMQELARHSLRLHAQYAENGLETGFVARGALDVFLTEQRLARAAAKVTEHAGQRTSRLLSAAEAREIEPTLGEVAGAIQHPDDAQCDSRMFVAAALQAAESHGAVVRWNTTVHRLGMGTGGITSVETDHGRFTADTYVLAGGLGTAGLARGVGIKLPMLGAKGYVVDMVVDGPRPRQPLTIAELKVVATPYPDRLRLCGTLELGSESASTSARRVEAIRAAGRRALPEVRELRTLETWAGMRPCTADGVPVIGRSGDHHNLVVAAGHGMWGLMLGPVTGAIVADGVVEGAATLHETAFSPDRFSSLAKTA
jgi:D-amino-acid dehydrogenase